MKQKLNITITSEERTALEVIAEHEGHGGNLSATVGWLIRRHAAKVEVITLRSEVRDTIAAALKMRPKQYATLGSTWWLLLDDAVSWEQIPIGREPFEMCCLNMGRRVLPKHLLAEEFELALYGLLT